MKKNKIPSKKVRSPDQNKHYRNKIKTRGISITKFEKELKTFLKNLNIDEFKLNDLFFISVLRKKNFAADSISLEMAISKVLSSKRPIKLEAKNGVLIVANFNRSIVIYLFEEKNVIWASTNNLSSLGYFKLEDRKYYRQYNKWKRSLLDLAFEKNFLQEKSNGSV